MKEPNKFVKAKNQQKKQQRKMTVEEIIKARKKKRIILATSVTIAIIAIFFSTIFALVNINNEKIIEGISISGIDVSGLTKEEANSKIGKIYQEKKEKEIALKYQNYETTINPTLIETNYDIEQAIEQAYQIGKDNNIFINNYNIIGTLIGKRNINVTMTLNEEIAKQTIQDIGMNLPGLIIESSYSVEENELIITKGKEGIIINNEKLLTQIKENLNNISSNNTPIKIPVEQKKPEPINIEKIHEEVHKEVQDAYYTKDPFTIYPEVNGIDFNIEEAKKMLEEDKEEYTIKLTITKPKKTIEQIGGEAFPDQLATFTTRYDISDVDRTTNLQIACQKINGKVILAGDTFSYNQTLGPRTVAAGYKNGKIYSAGEVVDGIGGGICQISSTLYNAVLMANLEIVERRNHQFVTSYVPAGRDATVVYGATDFKFKNTRKYPVRIVASSKSGIATVSIYGIKEENEYTFSFNTKTIATIPSTTKYEDDPSMPTGTEKIKQKGTNGLKTQTYITKMLNGKVISTTLLSKDTYDAMAKIITKGTGPANNEPTQETTPTTTPPETQQQTNTNQNQTQTNEPTNTQTPENTAPPETTRNNPLTINKKRTIIKKASLEAKNKLKPLKKLYT